MTYLYGTLILAFLYAPLLLVVAFAVDRSFVDSDYDALDQSGGVTFIIKRTLRFLSRHTCVILLLCAQCYHAYVQARTYGAGAAAGPYGLGFPMLTAGMYARAVTMRDFEDVRKIWG